MAGRTERVNARDILNRAEGIIFEGDVVRDWLEELERRARGTLKAAATNRYFDDEWKPEYMELSEALQALNKAKEQLEIFEAAVAKREKPRPEDGFADFQDIQEIQDNPIAETESNDVAVAVAALRAV